MQTTTLLCNAFSIGMLTEAVTLRFEKLSVEEARRLAVNARSIVGHQETAQLFESILGVPVPCLRETYAMSDHDQLLIGQYQGPRLPVGVTTLPEGASIQWWLVGSVESDQRDR